MRSLFRAQICTVALACAVAMPVAAQSTRPTVAILNFDYGTVQKWWSGTQDIGAGISDQLVNDATFRVIERKRLDAIMAEQDSRPERARRSEREG